MPRFPKREAEVVALADAMIAGYTANPGVFPNADPPRSKPCATSTQPPRTIIK